MAKKSIEALRHRSIKLYPGMKVFHPDSFEMENIDLSFVSQFDGMYAVKNHCLCFVDDKQGYVIPVSEEAENLLKKAGLKKTCFWVPFSDGSVPSAERQRWSKFLALASAN